MLNQSKPFVCTLQVGRAVWIKNTKKKTKNASYEPSQVLKTYTTLGIGTVVWMVAACYSISIKMVVFNRFYIGIGSFIVISFMSATVK